MFTAECVSHTLAATRQRNGRQADFRCGANPQRGESSWAFRLKICDLSPVSSPPATSGIASNSGETPLHLLIPQLRAVMDTRLTAMRMENNVETAMRKEIDELSTMPVGQLRQKYLEVFGEESRSNHKQFLFRRIAWRIQAIAEGGLSERARRRALEIANDADLRVRAGPSMRNAPTASGRRTPSPGRRSARQPHRRGCHRSQSRQLPREIPSLLTCAHARSRRVSRRERRSWIIRSAPGS